LRSREEMEEGLVGVSRAMMVLLVKQVHLQNDVGVAAREMGRRMERKGMR